MKREMNESNERNEMNEEDDIIEVTLQSTLQ